MAVMMAAEMVAMMVYKLVNWKAGLMVLMLA